MVAATRQLNIKLDTKTRDDFVSKCEDNIVDHIGLLNAFINYMIDSKNDEFEEIVKMLRRK